MDPIELLCSDGYIVTNRDLACKIGTLEAVLVGELCSEYRYWKKQNQLDKEGFFYSTQENIEKSTGMSPYIQRRIISNLQNIGILETDRKCKDGKRRFKLNGQILSDILNNTNFDLNNWILRNSTSGNKEDGNKEAQLPDVKKLELNKHNKQTQTDTFSKEKVFYVATTTSKSNDIVKPNLEEFKKDNECDIGTRNSENKSNGLNLGTAKPVKSYSKKEQPFIDLIAEMFNKEEVRNALVLFYRYRNKRQKNGLDIIQWKIMLQQFIETNKDYFRTPQDSVNFINKCITGGRNDLTRRPQDNNEYTKSWKQTEHKTTPKDIKPANNDDTPAVIRRKMS